MTEENTQDENNESQSNETTHTEPSEPSPEASEPSPEDSENPVDGGSSYETFNEDVDTEENETEGPED